MIVEPHNDTECLGALAEHARALIADPTPELVELASRFQTMDEAIEYIRQKPQRDDNGARRDGPRLAACSPAQRYRFDPDDPNCFERTLLLAVLLGLIRPDAVVQFRTENTPAGMHTFPIVDGEEIALSPQQVPRNAIVNACRCSDAAALTSPEPMTYAVPLDIAIDWIAELATELAVDQHTANAIARAREVMLVSARGLRVPVPATALREVAVTLAIAERAARAFGPDGVTLVQRTQDVLMGRTVAGTAENLRNLSLRIGGYTFRPDFDRIEAVGRVAGQLGGRMGLAAARAYLGSVGITPEMLTEIDRALGGQGLTLGALATEPAIGSLGAAAASYARR